MPIQKNIINSRPQSIYAVYIIFPSKYLVPFTLKPLTIRKMDSFFR